MDFSALAKKRMGELGMRPSELARKTGYSVQYIIDLLAGHRRWNETTISRVSKVLGITVSFHYDNQAVPEKREASA